MKGFTLVELLAVLVILGIIITITTPIVIESINTSAEKLYNEQIILLENASAKWLIEHTGEVDRSCALEKCKCISIEELKQGGYIPSTDVINPKTKEAMNGCVKITYDEDYKQFNYKYTELN